ncbi:hypothetical protein ACWZJV_27960 [Nocardioides sp. WG-D5]
MNPLNKYPKVREFALMIQWITTGLTTVGGIALAGIYDGVDRIPGWYNVAVMGLAALWTYTGLTAQGNVTGTDPEGYQLPKNLAEVRAMADNTTENTIESKTEAPVVVAEPEDEGDPDEMADEYVDDIFVAVEDKEGF